MSATVKKTSEAPKKPSGVWSDKLGPVTTFLASVIIGGAGVLATHLYNNGQLSLKKEEIAGQLELKKREIEGQLSLKDREETRHTKVELTEALDKYSHYMFSADPREREFGYNLFTQLGYTELALKIGQTTADPAILKVAESQIENPNMSIRGEAARTLAILTLEQRVTIRELIVRAEGGHYDSVGNFDPVGLSFGLMSWSLGQGLEALITSYSAHPNAIHANELRPFLDRIKAKDKTLADNPVFMAALKSAGTDIVMQRIEDAAVDALLEPTLKIAADYALRLPLSIAVMHDVRVNMGDARTRQLAEAATNTLRGSPATGIPESQWVREFSNRRIAYLKDKYPNLFGLQKRSEMYADLIEKGDWSLKTTPTTTEFGAALQGK